MMLIELTLFWTILGIVMIDYVGVKKSNAFGKELELTDRVPVSDLAVLTC